LTEQNTVLKSALQDITIYGIQTSIQSIKSTELITSQVHNVNQVVPRTYFRSPFQLQLVELMNYILSSKWTGIRVK